MSSIYYQDDSVILYYGECLHVLREMESDSVHSIVTDPPYGLSNTTPAQVSECLQKWTSGEREYVPKGGKGFMGKAWDSFVPPPAVWDECFRVLKPGGHLLSFAGSRTQDLMGMSIRLAGFDIRDSISWIMGSGFPKSLDVSKAIDKSGGTSSVEQSRILCAARFRSGLTREQVALEVGCTVSSVRDWEEGRARAVGRAVEFITPSADYREKLAELLGYTTDERVIVGIGGGSRGLYKTGHRGIACESAPSTSAAQQWQGWGTALKPAVEPIIVARRPLEGTVAANVLKYGAGALNIDGCRVGMSDEDREAARVPNKKIVGSNNNRKTDGRRGDTFEPATGGRWPANVVLSHNPDCDQRECSEGCPVAELDGQSGQLTSGKVKPEGFSGEHSAAVYGKYAHNQIRPETVYGDTGGASRFFPVFKYQAKASKKERPKVKQVVLRLRDDLTDDQVDSVLLALLEADVEIVRDYEPACIPVELHSYFDEIKTSKEITHPTVKPLSLMRWLVKLVTPPGGICVDPFLGSGTTAEACVLEGFRCVGIESFADYLPLAVERLTQTEKPK